MSTTLAPSRTFLYHKMKRRGFRMRVDGTITRRKIAALQAIGYSLTDIGARMTPPRHQQNVSETFHSTGPVHYDTAKMIAAIYDELHLTQNTSDYAPRTIARARRLGYAPPLAWDHVNDPNDSPKGLRK